MSAKESALELLAQGIAPGQVAESIGVEASYISQLMSDEDFLTQLQERKSASTQEDLDYDKKLDRVEGEFLSKIEEKSRFANLQQSLQAFKVINGAKRRKDSRTAPAGTQIGVIVTLNLPVSMLPQYQTNSKNEIVEVEGKTMVSATPKKLDEILALRSNGTPTHLVQLPGITKVERAAGVLQSLEHKPTLKMPKRIKESADLSDFL